jgi:putative ABC transport system permease protein
VHGPRGLRWLAWLLVRGAAGRFIRVEMEEAYARDIARGMPAWRARVRYVGNVFGSALSVWRGWRAPQVGFSWLDVKLGMRMLLKQPALTGVAVFALAIGIPAGLAPAHFVGAIESPFPVPEGDRIRAVRQWNTAVSRVGNVTWFEYAEWRTSLTAFDALGAVRTGSFNVEVDGALGEPVAGAQMTASAFEVLALAPILGRTLDPRDDVMGAPAVVVIGYDLWQARLGADPGVAGRTIRIGGVPHTIVGVMPRGFRFPVAHQLWVPMRESAAGAPEQGLPLVVVGRLAEGVTTAAAQRQLGTVGARMARSFPTAYEHLRPEVVHAAYMMVNIAGGSVRSIPEFHITQVLTLLLLVVACTNVSLLMYARMASRSSELAVRTALGASRARILAQIFTECLVLAVLAAGAGLLIIELLPRVLPARVMRLVPWWMDFGVTPTTVARALSLAVVSAAAAGVLPALRLTGRAVQRNIQRARAQRSGVRFGGVTTALVVADVAIAIAIVGSAMAVSNYLRDAWNGQDEAVGFAAEHYLVARLRIPWPGAAEAPGTSDRDRFAARLADVQRRLVERLEAEPGVRGVAVANVLPRMQHPTHTFHLDDETAGDRGHRVMVARVDPGFFDAFDKPILAGRAFDRHDAAATPSPVIVNTAFVSEVLNGRNPIGRRIRYAANDDGEADRWYEIVGLVGPLGIDIMATEEKAGLYHPLAPGETQPYLAVHVGGDPAAFTARLRTIAGEVDATAVITDTMPLADVFEGDWYFVGAIVLGGVLLIGILVALAASAIYAMMSFAVTQRTREIGIRAALGADPGRLVLTITRRGAVQLGLGALCGVPLAIFLFTGLSDGPQQASDLLTLLPGILAVLAIGALACAAPARRALRIPPTEALRDG